MKLRNPLLIRILAAIAAAGIWCWIQTLRFRQFGLDGRTHPTNAREKQVLYAFWHDGIFGTLCPPGTCRGLKALISQHADGEFIAQVCQWLGLGVVRGSTTRGGRQAVHVMLREAGGDANLAITPDGPRGPRREMQPGAVWIASSSGLPIVLIGVGYARAWRANSWDRFGLPVPGSRVTAVFSQPIHIPADLDRDGLEQWRSHLERELTRINDVAEAWAARMQSEGSRAPLPEAVFVPPPDFAQTPRAKAA